MKFYTGIGHRDTPLKMRRVIVDISKKMNALHYHLRSGGAEGADSFFEVGAGTRKEIYLPWKGFNDSMSQLHTIRDEDMEKVEQWYNDYTPHRPFSEIKEGARKLFTRNYYQLVGYDNTKSRYVFYYGDENAEGTVMGGTGFALYMATQLKIPIYNVKDPEQYKKIVGIINREKYLFIMSAIKHMYLFHYDEIKQADKKAIEILSEVELSDLKEYEELRHAMMSKFKEYSHLVEYKDIKLGSRVNLDET